MRVVLHIGTEKTATTTLQNFVYANRDALRRHGVALSDCLDKTNNRKLAAYCMPAGNFDDYFKDRRIATIQQKQAYFDGFREQFIEEARQAATWAHTLFITSEHFHSRVRDEASIARLKSVLDEISDDVVVLCWFREQSAVLLSLYSTAMKSGNVAELGAFVQRCTPSNDYFNYLELFTRWQGVFKGAQLRAFLFGTEHFIDGDIRRSLLQEVLPDVDPSDFDFSAPPANRSLGAVGLELARATNRAFPRYNVDGSLNARRAALIQLLANSEIGRAGVASLREAAEIHARFERSNLMFSRRFLKKDCNPFPAPDPGRQEDQSVTLAIAALGDFYGAALRECHGDPTIGVHAGDIGALRALAARLRRGDPASADDAALLDRLLDGRRTASAQRAGWLRRTLDRVRGTH